LDGAAGGPEELLPWLRNSGCIWNIVQEYVRTRVSYSKRKIIQARYLSMTSLDACQDERRSRLLDAMPAIAWSADAQTFRFNYINPAAEVLLGYPAERWLNESAFWVEHIHPDDRYVAGFCHNETLACRDHELVYRMIAADGRVVWLRDYVNVHTLDGVPVELFGVMVDITREREAEAASREDRENFRRMVELSPDCIGVHVDATYVYVNQAFVQLLGAESEAEIVGASFFSFIDPAFREMAQARMERIRGGEPVPYVRQKYRRMDGSLIDVEVAALPLRYGNRDAMQVILRDITDRVRGEEELRAREARLQLLSSGTHEAIWEWSPERKELWTNEAYRQLFGSANDPGTFIDEWLSRVHPEDRGRAQAVATRAVEEQLPAWWHEYRFRHADGTYRVVLDRGHNVKPANGERRLIGSLLDVTPLREAERLRAAAEAKFRWLVEQSVVAVYMISGERLTYINDTGAKMLGYSADELTAMDLSDLVLETEKRDSAVAGRPRVAHVRRKDGTTLHLAFYQNEVVVDGEKIVIGTSTDITESLHAQQALEASEQRYRELVEDVTDILYTVDRDGRFVSLSRSFERSTGYAIEEWLGRPFEELFLPRSVPAAVEHFRHTLGGDGGIIREYELVARSGEIVTIEVSAHPRYVDGEVSGTIGMARDVTEHRNITRKLEEAKRMSSLGQVAASLAHEFNNVLMGIQPFVEMIGRTVQLTRPVSEALGHITSAISRGKRASQEILRFANPKEPQLFAIDARTWLPALLGQLVAALPASISLSSSMDPGVRFLRGDREHLEQVITNLVFNARDAIIGGGTIHVDVSLDGVDGDYVRISVCDDGPGVPAEMLDRIFEPLFTTKRNGTGLGLAIARRLMGGQGGALAAENRPEGGSAFHLLIPAGEAPSPAVKAAAGSDVPSVKRILLVEDDLSVGTGLEELLKSEGYETTWVRAAGDACEAARRIRPQVAIIDVNLPDGNGVDLVPLLRAEHVDLPVVLSTGHVELKLSNDEKRIFSLMKPYELSDLLVAIGNVTAAA
jgi:two-component system, cell cycle sensor histidine kinase and response regulator CckA